MDAPVRLPVASIYPSPHGRAVDRGHVSTLAESIRAIGLHTPISVRNDVQFADGREIQAFTIVAGRHRYEAALSLGWKEIDAVLLDGDPDDAELWEIDENFARAELTDAQRADCHARRERILVAKGLVRKGPGQPKNGDNLSSYSDQAAAVLGVDKRTVQRDLARGKNIDPDILAEVSGTDLDKGVVLDELAKTPKPEQRAALAAIQERRAQVKPAPDPLDDPDAHEKQLSALMAAWNRAAAVVRQEFLLRIDQPVFDATRSGRAA